MMLTAARQGGFERETKLGQKPRPIDAVSRPLNLKRPSPPIVISTLETGAERDLASACVAVETHDGRSLGIVCPVDTQRQVSRQRRKRLRPPLPHTEVIIPTRQRTEALYEP